MLQKQKKLKVILCVYEKVKNNIYLTSARLSCSSASLKIALAQSILSFGLEVCK
jgi:hypothetical protein